MINFNMLFSYNWLQSYFKRKLPKPEKLADLLTLYFAEVEEVEKKESGDFVLNIDIRPNRAGDCFSHIGLSREMAAILNYKLQITDYKLLEDKKLKTKDFIRVKVRSAKACPRYTARVVSNVKIFHSPKWLKERLVSCGLRPINNIVDATNYVMLETGQPLHAFDFDKIEGKNQKSIIVRFAKKKEKITTLDQENYDFGGNEDILAITDDKGPLAVAGIKGGKKAEIDPKTRTIILEAANFSQRVVRRSSKAINLKTDASLRFEHGLDPNLTEIAINKAAVLIQKIAGGKISEGLVDVYPVKVLPKTIKINTDYVKSLLGIEIPEQKIIVILKSLGFKIKNYKLKIIEVEVPTSRLDVSLSEDLIEDIGRIYGYQKIPAVLPASVLVPPKQNLDIFWEDLAKDILKEAGFNEAYNYSFISSRDAEIFRFKKEELVELENPLSSDFLYLRPSLIPNLLKNIEKNQKNFIDIKIYELGKIFHNQEKKRMLTGVIAQGLPVKKKGQEFYEAKGVVDAILNKMGISDIWYDEYNPTPEESKISVWYPQRCAEIKVGQEEIGFLGEINPRISSDMRIEKRTAVFDLDFEKLAKLALIEQEYRQLSKFPSAVRDIAVLVPQFIKVEEVLNKIDEAGSGLVRDVDLFDIYEGEELKEGKKSLAFHIIYQAEDRTLTSKEIDEIQNKIIASLEQEPEWQVRK